MRSDSKVAVGASSAAGAAVAAVPATEEQAYVLYRREEEPSDESPLYYREDVYVMPEGVTEADAERYLRDQLALIQMALGGAKPGKFVNLAVFDRAFEGRPSSPPLVTLSWKDWKGDGAVIAYPRLAPTTGAPEKPSGRPLPETRQSGVRDSVASAAAVSPPAAAPSVPPPSIAALGEALKRASQPPAGSPPAGILALGQAIERATSQPPPPPASAPPESAPIQPAPILAAVPSVAPAAPPASVAPPIADSVIVSVTAETVVNPQPASVIPPAPIPAAGTPSSPPPAVPRPNSVPPPAAPVVASAPPPPAPVISAPPPPAPVASAPPPPAPVISAPPPPAPEPVAQRLSSRPSFSDGRPVRGDELIAVLFEAMHDLHFARDTIEAAQYCLHLALEKIPSRAAFAHFYDIDKREFVLAAAVGAGTEGLLLKRHPPTDPLLASAMRKRSTVVVVDATTSDDAFVERFETIGGAKSVLVTPVMLGGRALAAIELVNPIDAQPFSESEGNAFTYMGEQFAEYVSSHGLVLDPDRIKRV